MKTPISYYGGKQQMIKHILPLIPNHDIYVEPFFGGGAVFWVVTTQGFSCKIGTWGYDRDKRSITIQNKVDAFNEELKYY